ncbi:MAG: agmatine deiminase family protein [Planctomycetes bacterium]|nr:agmatine deiminase family protein [Planctomycetota bacterium]
MRLALVGMLVAASFAGGIYVAQRATPRKSTLVPAEALTPGRVVAEFERQDAMMLGCNELVDIYPETLIDLVRELDGHIAIVALVRSQEQRVQMIELLHKHGLSSDNIHYFVWPAASMWVQDFGPQVVVGDEPRIVDFEYHYPNRGFDGLLPAAFASWCGLPLDHSNLALEGGCWLTNGQGLCLATNTLVNMNLERGHKLPEIASALRKHLNFNKLTHLQQLKGEPLGHIDMFLTLTGPNVAVVASCDPGEDPENAKILDDNVRALAEIQTSSGPMSVVRLPMPTHRDGQWRTYNNVLFANDVLLVPQYPGVASDLDRQAIETFQRLLPAWKVVGIDCTKLIEHRGALHCISLNIPRLPTALLGD